MTNVDSIPAYLNPVFCGAIGCYFLVLLSGALITHVREKQAAREAEKWALPAARVIKGGEERIFWLHDTERESGKFFTGILAGIDGLGMDNDLLFIRRVLMNRRIVFGTHRERLNSEIAACAEWRHVRDHFLTRWNELREESLALVTYARTLTDDEAAELRQALIAKHVAIARDLHDTMLTYAPRIPEDMRERILSRGAVTAEVRETA